MGTPIKRSIGTIQQHQHCTIPSTTSMKIAILSLVLVSAVSIDGGVLKGNGMEDIHSIIETIDNMSKAATDLNTMESRLEGLSTKKDTVDSAFAALKNNLDKTKLGTNSADNKHDNLKWNDDDKEWVAA